MSWIGGDLGGLQAMGNTMKPAQDLTNDVVRALSAQVDKVVTDAGWSGSAADQFRQKWIETSVQVGGLATANSKIGQALGDLGDQLQQIEADLYNTAQEAKKKGAQIGEDGKPLTLVITGDPDAAAAKQAREAQKDYTTTYNFAIHTAQGFRLNAAKTITDVIDTLSDPGHSNDFSWDKRVTVADYIRGLYAVPNEKNSEWSKSLPDKIKTAEAEMDNAHKEWSKAFNAYNAAGKKLPLDSPEWANAFKSNKDLTALQTKLTAAESGKGELPLSKALNTKIGDVDKLLPDLAKTAPKGMEFMKQIPVVDVAASAAVAEIQARGDIEKGQNSTEARAEDYGAAAAGIATGVGVVAGAGALGVSAPAWATAAVGGAVVIGAGDVFYDGFHEHWGEDIHDHGVWRGTVDGLGDTFSTAGGDLGDLGKSTGSAVASLWKKIF